LPRRGQQTLLRRAALHLALARLLPGRHSRAAYHGARDPRPPAEPLGHVDRRYPQNEKIRWEHLERIGQHLLFQQCDDFQRQRFLKHLTETAQALPYSDALRQKAWRWLQEQRIVRPSRTTLRDLLTAVRGALQHRLRVVGPWIDC
jgi:hypothetical protein